MRVDDMEAAVGLRVRQREARAGVEPKTQKLSIRSSVSGVPCKTAAWGDGGMRGVRVGDMEAAWVLHVRQCEAWGRGLDQKPETERLWLGFRGAA